MSPEHKICFPPPSVTFSGFKIHSYLLGRIMFIIFFRKCSELLASPGPGEHVSGFSETGYYLPAGLCHSVPPPTQAHRSSSTRPCPGPHSYPQGCLLIPVLDWPSPLPTSAFLSSPPWAGDLVNSCWFTLGLQSAEVGGVTPGKGRQHPGPAG